MKSPNFFALAFFGSIAIVAFIGFFEGCNCNPTKPEELLEIKHENVVKVLFHRDNHATIMKKVENSKEIALVIIYADKIKYFADVPTDKPMSAIVRVTKDGGNNRNAEIHLHENFQIGGGNTTVGKNEQGYTSVIE